MRWANFFHAYQPPGWDPSVIRKVVRESYAPFFGWLESHPRVRVTTNIAGSLLEQLDILQEHNLLALLRRLVSRGQVELVQTAMYHPLLPLIPTAFVKRQFAQHRMTIEKFFGVEAQGTFLPEMAFAPELAPALKEWGAAWVLLDEIALEGKLGVSAVDARYRSGNASLDLLFRNRIVSDYLFFSADLRNENDFWRAVHADGRSSNALLTAMDLENLGHHRPELDRYWQALVSDARVTTVTLSELLGESDGRAASIVPLPSSWATREEDLTAKAPFPLWRHPDNPLHQLQWQLTDLVLAHASPAFDAPNARLVDQAISSDQYWWASATPWWDVGIIERGARGLLQALRASAAPATALKRGADLCEEIAHLARAWHAEGEADARRNRFLASIGHSMRLGGDELKKKQ